MCGADALAALDGSPWQLVMMDADLPDTTGDRLLAAILERRPAQRVVVASGHGARAILDAALVARVTSFLPKPYGLDELRACLVAVEAG